MGLITSMVSKSSLPGEFRGPVAWLLDAGGGRRSTASGSSVSEAKALTVSEVFGCVRVIGEDIAKLPLILYRRAADGRNKDRAVDLPLYGLLHDEPNPDMGAFDFRQALGICAALWGSGYAEIERDDSGNATALWPLVPWRVKPTRINGSIVYRYSESGDGRNEIPIPARDMIHLKGPSIDGLMGILIGEVGAESLGMAMAAHDFTASFFRDGTSQRGVVKFKRNLGPEEIASYRQQFEDMYAGAMRSHGWMAIGGDADVTTLTTDPEKSQLIETMRFSLEQVCRYFRVSPHKVYDRARAQGWSTLEMTNQEHLVDSLMPWLVRLEQELSRKLLFTFERRDLVIEHLVDAILRADIKTRYESYAIGIANKFILPNEARAKENLNAIEGGDEFAEPAAPPAFPGDTATDDMSGTDAAGDQRAEKLRADMMPVFVDASQRIVTRERKSLTRQTAKDPAWLDEWCSKHHAYVTEAVSPPLDTLCRLMATRPGSIAEQFATRHIADLRQRLAAGEDPQTWTIDRPARMAEQLTNEVTYATE